MLGGACVADDPRQKRVVAAVSVRPCAQHLVESVLRRLPIALLTSGKIDAKGSQFAEIVVGVKHQLSQRSAQEQRQDITAAF